MNFTSLLFFKLVNTETTINLQIIFEPYKNNYLLRGNNKKFTCRHHFNNDVWHKSFFYRSVEMRNKLPNEFVSCEKVEKTRLKLKKINLNKIFISKIYK